MSTSKQRKVGPALYELVGNGRARTSTEGVRPRTIDPESEHEHKPQPQNKPQSQPQRAETPPTQSAPAAVEGEFGPGRSVRMPAGILFFFIFGVVGALVAGYLIGYQQRGREAERSEAQARIANADLSGINDPLNQPVNPDLINDDDTVQPRRDDPQGGQSTPEGGSEGTRDEPPVVVDDDPDADYGEVIVLDRGVTDPRQRGLNYLAVTQIEAERAPAFLEYLASNGVDALAEPVNNGVYRIWTLRGFNRDEYRTQRRSYEDTIKRLTERYRAPDGLSVIYDSYWDKI